MITLTLFTRPACHLCEEMADALEPLVRGRASVEIVDISGDGALERAYGLHVPVLVAGDLELSRYRLDEKRVAGFLADSA